MKKMLLVLMLVVLSSLSFAQKEGREGDDFYTLYNEAYKAVGSPEMHKSIGLKSGEIDIVKEIINQGWYDIKMLEIEKLKHVFAIDKLLVDGEGNKDKVDEHIKELQKISDKMKKIYIDGNVELKKYIDMEKLK